MRLRISADLTLRHRAGFRRRSPEQTGFGLMDDIRKAVAKTLEKHGYELNRQGWDHPSNTYNVEITSGW